MRAALLEKSMRRGEKVGDARSKKDSLSESIVGGVSGASGRTSRTEKASSWYMVDEMDMRWSSGVGGGSWLSSELAAVDAAEALRPWEISGRVGARPKPAAAAGATSGKWPTPTARRDIPDSSALTPAAAAAANDGQQRCPRRRQ